MRGLRLLRAVIHPLPLAAATALGTVTVGFGSRVTGVREAAITTAIVILMAIMDMTRRPAIYRHDSPPTNFGHCATLLGITVTLGSLTTRPDLIPVFGILGRQELTIACLAALALLLTETVSRSHFAYQIWLHGHEGYARQKVERLASSKLLPLDRKIEAVIRINRHRSIEHEKHSKILRMMLAS